MLSKTKDDEDPSVKESFAAMNNKLTVIINILNLQQEIMVDIFEDFTNELKNSK